MDFKDLIRKIEEAEAAPAAKTPQTYARAQEQMKRLEAAAQYSGTDEIVRSRYGLPPPLPPYEQWDGSMPQAGEADWLTRNVLGRQASANVQSMNKTNQAQTASDAQVTAQVEKLNALVAQLQQLHATAATPAPAQAGTPTGTSTPAAAPAGTTTKAPAKPQPNDIAKKLQAMPSGVNAGQDESIDYGIANQLVESFGYTTESEASLAQQAALGTGVWGATKLAGKTLGKALPGVGLAFGAADAYRRATKGDYTGAALAGASGLASMVPGVGTAASFGLDAANAARDYKHGEYDGVFGGDQQAAAPAGTTNPAAAVKGDPKVFALQQKLITKGAQIKADGIMGPKTQAAMQQYGITAESLAETVVSLKDRMAMIEAEQQALDEGLGDYLKAGSAIAGKAWQGIKGAAGAAGTGAKQFAQGAANPNAFRTAAGQSAIKAGTKGKTAYTAGQAVARNPGKAGLAATALGLGAGAALTPGATGTTPVASTGGKTGGKTGQTPSTAPVGTTTTPATPAGPTPEEKALINQINAIMQGFGDVDSLPDDMQQAVQAAQNAIQSVSAPAPTGSAALDPAKNPNPATNIPGGPETAVSNPPAAPVNQSAGTPNTSNLAESMTRWKNIING